MLEPKDVLKQLFCKIGLFILAGLIWVISLPIISVEAAGYYGEKNHKVEVSRPYYTNKQRRIDRPQNSQPYYANKDRKKEKASIRTPDDEYTTSHKQIRRNRGDFE
ncbi:hypothetical protein ACN23B_18745 [Anabaena sp. FACHB-709]|uniref:Uncharacterized protein n=2 Tax=Nostocaceae TaxID=1162 RepID=A0A1Z4KK71_ANAVA|nr:MULTISPECIES: hypothetical protein [Nostocaceae]BAY69358.1 hypothetical protein NIES23_21520 [Trichormus variabilis NIES-23]HBW30375.1 hypothetical protein [Nostoc sp. UBA8866]MBD2175234.1 hypothetical protein [Anabaena cylindrica FACHB-318]MBD2267129.1 hypothetical protein [Anabaena sp. FACHB-709]MBD2276682.1 hypothetical protein [Nostoc sp. PCC 7120 = FACHB-418]